VNYFITYRRDAATKSFGVPLGFKVGALNAPKTLNFGGHRMYQNRPKPVSEEYLKAHAARLLPLLEGKGILCRDESGREIDVEEFKRIIAGSIVTQAPPIEETVSSEPPGAADEQEPLDEEPATTPEMEPPATPETPEAEIVEIKPEFEAKQIHVELQEPVQETAAPESEAAAETAEQEPAATEQSAAPAHVYTKEELDQLPFNDLRATVKTLGLKGDGTRKVLIERILDSQQQGQGG
jgi:hypothetical protein